MKFALLGFPHGNGPYMRAADLVIALNKLLKDSNDEQFKIIMPLLYEGRQQKILLEEYKNIINENEDLILLDSKYGEFQNEILYKEGDYNKHLELFVNNQESIEQKINNHLSGKIKLKNLNGKEIIVNANDIELEVNHNPRFKTNIEKSVYTTIAYFSEILKRTMAEDLKDFDKNILNQAIPIAQKIEDDKELHLMPEPFVFSYDKTRKIGKEIFTPPFIHMPKANEDDVEKGMYVMVSGIDAVRDLYVDLEKFGLKIYCPPFIKDIQNANNSYSPDFVSNKNIKYQFARTGWSSVWISHMTETPLITPKYRKGDDPEIFFNEKSVLALKLATIIDENTSTEKLLKEAENKKVFAVKINDALIKKYGTLDGMSYSAKITLDYLQGNSLDKYMKKPALNGGMFE